MSEQFSLSLSIHKVICTIHTIDIELYERLKNDFSVFIIAHSDRHDIELTCHLSDIPHEKIKGKPCFLFRKIKTFDDGDIRINFYPEGLLSIYDFNKNSGELFSRDINLLHEVSYLLILSRIGKIHDLNCLHRIHAMGVVNDKNCIIACGDSGAGKSTSALKFIAQGYRLIADDTCLLSCNGSLRALPVRMGFNTEVPNMKFSQTLLRRQFGKKYLYDVAGFAATMEPHRNYSILLLHNRNRTSSLVWKSSLSEKITFLSKYLLIGLGTPQIAEYFWQRGLFDFYIKSKIFLSRLYTLINIIRTRSIHSISLKDGDELYDVLLENSLISESSKSK